jgi:A/G-specific adenine glycosylase
MLQQTQVSTALPYYERWMQRFPTVRALSAASTDQVLAAFQGLGYYSRARSLLSAARAVVERFGGELPRSRDELLSLPGIGPYSAGAIASIAFDERVPVIDGNVVRVLCRLFALRGAPDRAPLKSQLWQRAAELVPENRPGDFNQALMELGATVCTPRSPRCAQCPLRETCNARRQGLVEVLPEKVPRAAAEFVKMSAALVFSGELVAVVKRAEDAKRWAGMWQFPCIELAAAEVSRSGAERASRELLGIETRATELVCTIKHSVTRFRITLDAYLCKAPAQRRSRRAKEPSISWRPPRELESLAMPAAHRRIAAALAAREAS